MPFLKYTLFVGASLVALLYAADHLGAPAVASAPSQAASARSSSLELLRKMANHGEMRPFASAATAGPFLPMPAVVLPPVVAVAAPIPIIPAAPPVALNAQARVHAVELSERPHKPVKRVAARKPQQPRVAYVENVPREPSGFFGIFQSW